MQRPDSCAESRECAGWFVTLAVLINTSLRCGNLVPAPSHTTLDETSVNALHIVVERSSSAGFVWLKHF